MGTNKHSDEVKVEVLEKTKAKTEEPPLYRVFLLNDDYTPMEFVVDVIMQFFELSEPEATIIMLKVHKTGRGNCGVFTRDVAETKVNLVNSYAREHDQPLLCQMEQI